jgi:sugar lactone lactonase YvrE
MYHSDSKGPIIWAYDYDPSTGGIANRRVLAEPTAQPSTRTGSTGAPESQPAC